MSKQELIEFVAETANMSKAEAGRALDAVLAGITKGLKEKKEVNFVGFGKFTAKVRAAREGINPATKEPIHIAETVVAGFKAGSKLKDAIK